MSLPWLQDDFEDSSGSRSGSPLKEKEVATVEEEKPIDKSVQPLPQKSARRSRSRSSRHSHDSTHSRKNRDRNYRHSKRKRDSSSSSRSSRSYSSRSSSSSGLVPTRIIASTKLKYENARLYVTNIVSKEITRQDLIKHFKKYGEVVDAILHVKNYAVIQYGKEEQAQLAIEGERGKTFRGWHLGICLASERSSQLKEARKKENRGPRGSGERPRRPSRGQRWRAKRDGPPKPGGPSRPRGSSQQRGSSQARRSSQPRGPLEPRGSSQPRGPSQQRGSSQPRGHSQQRGSSQPRGPPWPRRLSQPRRSPQPRGPPRHAGEFSPPHHRGPFPPPHFEGPYPPPHERGPFPPPREGGPFRPPHERGPFPPPREGGPFPPPHERGPFPPPREGGPFPPPHERGPFPPPHEGGPFPPPHERGPFPPPHHGGPFPPPHEGGPFPPPHHGGPYPPHPRGPPGPFGPGPRDFRGRGPFFEDPYRHGPPEPWIGDGPFRPNTFEGPYGGPPHSQPFEGPPKSQHPAECEIFVMNPALRPYGEYVEEQIKNFSIVTSVTVKPANISPLQLVDNLRAKKVLFVIFISAQNETHKSLTLTVLHGSPQEHRNMPLDDAVSLILTSFRTYVAELKEKANSKTDPLSSLSKDSDTFLPASADVSYLIKLLADNRNLTVEELDTIIQYLTRRRDKLINPRSRSLTSKDKSPSRRKSPDNSPESCRRSLERRPRSAEKGRHGSLEEGQSRFPEKRYSNSPPDFGRSPGSCHRSLPMDLEEVSQSPKQEDTKASKAPSSITEDLKSKIIDILNSMRNTQNDPTPGTAQQQSKLPAAISLAASSQEPPPPPPPLPPQPPPLPANEFDNINSLGAKDSENSSRFNNMKPGLSDGVPGNSSLSAESQPLGASNFPPSFGAVNEDGLQQGTWQGGYDQGAWMQGAANSWQMQPGMEQTSEMSYQENYSYPWGYNQMGNNYGQPRY